MSSNGIISTVGARPVGRGQLMAGGLAATIGSLAQAQEAGASQGPVVTGAPAGVAGLAVTGVGEASAPAEAAVVQFIARFGGGFFPGKESAPVPATPVAVAVPDEALAALVAALTGAGVPEDAIETTTFPDGPFGGPFGPGTALILAQLDGDLLSQIPVIVNAALAAGIEQGIGFDQVGVGFTVAGCAAIEHQALADAVTNGRSQAEGLAEALGVTLGNLVRASRQPVYGYDGAAATSSCDALPSLDLARETYLPPFNPTQAPEVELYVQVNLTYAFA